MDARVTTLRSITPARDQQDQRRQFSPATREWPVDQARESKYSGDERRRQERRQSDRPTTLDTRKAGPDRRAAGRISLKV